MAKKFDPYRRWLEIRPDEVRTHYRLLGLSLFESHPATIEAAAERRMATVRSFESPEHAEPARKILDELAAAKACLLDPQQKAAYDEQLRAGFRRGPGMGSTWLMPGLILAGLGVLVAAAFFLIAWLGRAKQPPPVVSPPRPQPTLPVFEKPVLEEGAAEFPPREPEEIPTQPAVIARPVDSRPPSRLPVPSEEAQQAYRKLIEEVFDPAATKTPEEKRNVARQLLSMARQAQQGTNERYVLLDRAMQLAEEAGDAALTRQARDMLTSQFDLEKPPPVPGAKVEPSTSPTAESPGVRLPPETSSAQPQSDAQITAAEIVYPVRVGPIEFLAPPENLGPVVNSSAEDVGPELSQDNLTLLFSSERAGGEGGQDLWMCTRASEEEPWDAAVNLGASVNSSDDEAGPALSADACTLVFESNRPGGQGRRDIWMCTRDSADQPWGPPVNLGSPVNSSTDDGEPEISGDALTLMFQSYYRPRGMGHWDLWASKRDSQGQPWEEPANLGAPVNGPKYQTAPGLSPDRLVLVFGQGGADGDLWIATRATEEAPWTEPLSLGPVVNSRHREWCGSFSPDGRTLLFSSDRPGGRGDLDLYQVPIRLHAP